MSNFLPKVENNIECKPYLLIKVNIILNFFTHNRLKLGRLIDEGAFGRVYQADAYGIIPCRYKTVVAVKMLKGNFFLLN